MKFLYTLMLSEAGSLNKAAERLYIAQPSLTSAIKELEKELGITIFNRSGRGVTPTQDGTEFLLYARQIYSQYEDLMDKYTKKRDLFLKGLDDIGIAHTVPQGAYYILLDIAEFGYKSDLEFCEVLAKEVGVGAVPGSSFFREPVNNLIRLHFAKKDETLYEALNRLQNIRKKIPVSK